MKTPGTVPMTGIPSRLCSLNPTTSDTQKNLQSSGVCTRTAEHAHCAWTPRNQCVQSSPEASHQNAFHVPAVPFGFAWCAAGRPIGFGWEWVVGREEAGPKVQWSQHFGLDDEMRDNSRAERERLTRRRQMLVSQMLSCVSRRPTVTVCLREKAGHMKWSMRMRDDVSFGKARGGHGRVGVICRRLRHGPMTSSCDKVWRAMISSTTRPQEKAGHMARSMRLIPTYKVSTDNAETIHM